MGDPCGIGPEICLKAISKAPISGNPAITIVGSRDTLDYESRTLQLPSAPKTLEGPCQKPGGRGVIDLDNFSLSKQTNRSASAGSGKASLEYIRYAVEQIQNGLADGLVTAPINKNAIGAAGSSFPGHTEMLGDLTDTARPVMLLVNGDLRVAFVTTHLPLRDVAKSLTSIGISYTGGALSDALERYFIISDPSIAVCALNPHAGDRGRFGDEEERILEPAMEEMGSKGIDATGPLPSDTLFAKALESKFDGVIALYHDQGMIPIKLSGLDFVVNITLRLPFVRTSPGHGTAYDIAGMGVAKEHSLVEAIRLAAEMIRHVR